MTFEQLTNEKTFMEKINATESFEEAKALFAAEGVDLEAELKGPGEGELSEDSLENVAGGISWKAAVTAWNVGVQAGVIIRNVWDARHGRPLSYPNWKFEW